MGWTTNDLRIEMMNNEAAKNAAEAIKNYIAENKATYDSLNMKNFMEDLVVEKNSVIFDESYSMHGWEYMNFVPEICKMLAANASFKGDASCFSGYGDEGSCEFVCENGILNIRTVYYPNGYSEYLTCEECGEDVVLYDEYEAGKIYICPECGEAIDLSKVYENSTPEIKEFTYIAK